MRFLAIIALLIAACGKDSTGPALVGTTYCVDSVYYHLDNPKNQYVEDWVGTKENTFKLTLANSSDTSGTFESGGSVVGLIRFVYGVYVDTAVVKLLGGSGAGQWVVSNGRILFQFLSGHQDFLAGTNVYHSAPADNKFTSLWEYPKDVDNNYARLEVWWLSCD